MKAFQCIALLAAAVIATAEPASSQVAAPVAGQTASAPLGSGMVAAANPQAVEAGLKVLREGGGAIDAAVAVQAVLGLVEPQSSGLGGGAFMVYYDTRTQEVTAYDGRETAPAAATPDLFLGPDGKRLGFIEAIRSGRSTGVPGVVAMLALAHGDHGVRPWNTLFSEAERLADEGFLVGQRLAAYSGASGRTTPDVAAYLGTVKAGDRLKNPAYADTVRRIAAEGDSAILEGEIAKAIVARVAEQPLPGALSMKDLAFYEARKGPAVCRPYRVYIVCGPDATSGAPAVLMALGILENTTIADGGPTSAESWYQFAEASRLMYADRDHYFGDPKFVEAPLSGLLDPAYLKSRAALIKDRSEPRTAGVPPGAPARAPDATQEVPGTSHFVVVDKQGNVVSMTTTVEGPFGSGRMVHGFVLNNQLTDFSLNPRDASGALVANAPAPGKRPRSSMAPLIVLHKSGRFVAAIGSPGGNAIPAYNLKTVVGFLDWKLPIDQAVALPNLIARGANTVAETAKFSPGVVEGLAAKGITLRGGGGEGSGLHAVAVQDGRLVGAADPRREGAAAAP